MAVARRAGRRYRRSEYSARHLDESDASRLLFAAYCGDRLFLHRAAFEILYLLPTEADCRGFVVDDIEPMFDSTPILQGKLSSPSVARHDRNTMLHRLWNGGSLKVVAGKAPRNLRRHTARVLMIDEADAIEVSGEGDPIALAERRTLTFGDRKIIVGGTPIDASTSHVLRSYNESDQACGNAHAHIAGRSPKSCGSTSSGSTGSRKQPHSSARTARK